MPFFPSLIFVWLQAFTCRSLSRLTFRHLPSLQINCGHLLFLAQTTRSNLGYFLQPLMLLWLFSLLSWVFLQHEVWNRNWLLTMPCREVKYHPCSQMLFLHSYIQGWYKIALPLGMPNKLLTLDVVQILYSVCFLGCSFSCWMLVVPGHVALCLGSIEAYFVGNSPIY